MGVDSGVGADASGVGVISESGTWSDSTGANVGIGSDMNTGVELERSTSDADAAVTSASTSIPSGAFSMAISGSGEDISSATGWVIGSKGVTSME